MHYWVQLLFSLKGRVQRLYWWIGSLVVLFATGTLSQGIEFWARQTGSGAIDPETGVFEPAGPFEAGMFIIALVNIWINLALTVKRLHDRNRTGWWVAAPYLAILVAILLGVATMMQPEGQREPFNGFAVTAVLATTCLLIWMLVEIGFLRGTQGPNRFGPDPLATPQSDAKI
jgi:uncharacterized membrane protein YhaH (DUF805 family)